MSDIQKRKDFLKKHLVKSKIIIICERKEIDFCGTIEGGTSKETSLT